MGKPAVAIDLTEEERRELEGLAKRRRTAPSTITQGPFRWTKSADDILASIKRFCLTTMKIADSQAQIIKTSESGH